MKLKKLKSIINELPKTSDSVKNLLNNPYRFNIDPPEEMSAKEFILQWDCADDCFQYMNQCSSEELLSLSDLLTLMSDGTPIKEMLVNSVIPDSSVERLEVWYFSGFEITIPCHQVIWVFIYEYMTGKIKPCFTLKKLVNSLKK